jgi:phenylalanyl-tRNA synthetase beta chain
MKFTFNWLKEFVEISLTPAELGKMLTMAGLEVESIAASREPESGREDWLFEVAVTPNRGDCLGLAGIAREAAALTGASLKKRSSSAVAKSPNVQKRISITIEDPLLCPRYSARIVDQVRVEPSPAWLRYRLESCGIRAINNIVDVTNYVMLETGQPLHAFDVERLQHQAIVVRAAGQAMKFTTLDGVERTLSAEDLLICDGGNPAALAGLMGGLHSEVRDVTRSILLESANFSPAAIRRTARRLALHSEASHRFERGVDPEGTIAALNRAVMLLAEVAGGQAEAGLADRYPGKVKPVTVLMRQARIEKLLGTKIDRKKAAKLLGALGMKTRDQAGRRSLTVVPPTSRSDITREADVIEELARLHGYDQIPTTLPLRRIAGGQSDPRLQWERKARALLGGEGLFEAINLPFTTPSLNESFPGIRPEASRPVAVLNPLAKESAESLAPGLIENLRLNIAFKARSVHIYHLGKIFYGNDDHEIVERTCLAGLLHGPRERHGLRRDNEGSVGFLQCRGVVEAMLELFHTAGAVNWLPAGAAFLHPGKSAQLWYRDHLIGYIGELHPDLAQQLELPSFFLFELDFEKLLEYAPARISIKVLPRFPAVERDVALVVDRDFPAQQVIHWIKGLGEPLIEHVEVFDEYMGASIAAGKKSLAYKISYRAEDRTLRDAEIKVLHQRVVEQLGETFGAERRS